MSPTSQISNSVLDGPALAPPPGILPDFEHPESSNYITGIVNAICLTATVIFVCVRAYVKLWCVRKIHLEDGLMEFLKATYFTSIGVVYQLIRTNGVGIHQYNIRLKDLSASLYIFHVATNTFVISLCLTKAAILIEWVRIFVPRGTRNLFYWAAKILLIVIFLLYSAYIITENLSCVPHEKIWNKLLPDGYCIDDKIYQLPGALVSPVWITAALILPQRTIWKLQTSSENKIGISLIFLVGVWNPNESKLTSCRALGSSIARAQATVAFLYSNDKTYTISAVYLWTLAESTCTFLAFCAPAFPRAITNRYLLNDLLTRLMVRLGWVDQSQSNHTGARAWPALTTKAPRRVQWDTARVYHSIKDTTSSLGRSRKYDGSLSEPSQLPGQSISVPEQGILVTTSFTAEVTTVEECYIEYRSLGYPWTAQREIGDLGSAGSG
ncbi:hypothetical protein F5Y16DRAFT_421779 [Xylariaceae sp. FL0255]|nr:hypothetical protein F5Y16DRAFT_421779 [Xylariaceae sp. FL0255]